MSALVRTGRVFVVGIRCRMMEQECFVECRVYEYFKPPIFLTQAAVNTVCFFVVMSTAAVTGCTGDCGLSMRRTCLVRCIKKKRPV
jgi:hypothetical protein